MLSVYLGPKVTTLSGTFFMKRFVIVINIFYKCYFIFVTVGSILPMKSSLKLQDGKIKHMKVIK